MPAVSRSPRLPRDGAGVSPEAPAGLKAEPDGPKVNPASAERSQPNVPSGLRADMPALPKAGVDLVKRVLWIVILAIILLISYLFVIDLWNAGDLSRAYKQIFAMETAGHAFPGYQSLESLSARLDDAKGGKRSQLGQGDGETIRFLYGAGAITSEQERALKGCLQPAVPPAPGTSADDIQACIALVESLKQQALAASANTERVKLLKDVVKDVNENRQTFRAFWIQMAQLLLLNLLLPLLTALLGYIFGTQQAQSK